VAAGLAWASPALAVGDFRYDRELQAAPGWTRLEIPNEVLDQCRRDLADVRIVGTQGEIPYALEDDLAEAIPIITFSDVESVPARETSALLDRGENPPACSAIQVNIAGTDSFLKPVLLEASDERRQFHTIAKGSIFRTASGAMSRLRFAPNDRRYFRLRLDDRQSPAVTPLSAELEGPAVVAPRQVLEFPPRLLATSDESADTYAVQLPFSHLDVESLGAEVGDGAFSRHVRVYETMLFRNELSRRLVGEGSLFRSAAGQAATNVSLGDVTSRDLEVEVERATTRLNVKSLRLALHARRIVFFAAQEGPLRLKYGSTTSAAPKYDIVAALSGGRPRSFNEATLKGVSRAIPIDEPKILPTRGTKLQTEAWSKRQTLQLPRTGRVAFVDLPGAASRQLASVRIVDQGGRQVPYIVESTPRKATRALTYRLESKPGHTEVTIVGLQPDDPLERLTVKVRAPDYFERTVKATESVTDARGEVGRRLLGQMTWRRLATGPIEDLSITLEPHQKADILLDIDDGDNPSITLTGIVGESSLRRIDLIYEPNDVLTLYWGQGTASAPHYDFALIADAVLSSPALPALLGPVENNGSPRPATPRWFWWAAAGAGLVVVLVFARTLRFGQA
jgi:hypothetical protein